MKELRDRDQQEQKYNMKCVIKSLLWAQFYKNCIQNASYNCLPEGWRPEHLLTFSCPHWLRVATRDINTPAFR